MKTTKNTIPVFIFVSALAFVPVPPPLFSAFEDIGIGARGRGLGDSVTALDDVNGAPLNPALPGSARKFETGVHFEAGTRSSLGPLDFDSYAFNASVPRMAYGKFGTLSVLGRYRTFSDLGLKEKTFSLGWATWQFRKSGMGILDIGAGLKFMQLASADTTDSNMALGFDLGAMWRGRSGNSVGLSLLNPTRPSFKAGALKYKTPFSVRLGVAEKREDYTLTLDIVSRSGVAAGNFSLNSGVEYRWRTYRSGIFASRAGLSLADKASFFSLGLGYRRLASEISYSFLVPVNGAIVPGHALSVNIRFGDKDQESDYERLIRQEVKYRKDLVEALDESSRREAVLRDELSALKEEIDSLNAGLKAAREQKAEVAQAREKLEAIVERQRRAQAELQSLEKKRRGDKLAQLQFDFNGEWQAYLKVKAGGAPKDALKGALQRLVGQYQGAGIDISRATLELQKIVQQGE
ncbi:MAG: hypothetical protein A2270_05950 [Elusimicrobia bacterium RIFOXYA12_FULL_51_18]|nr:MAG: hypothetical protein A2270_05950 [Elusimicrobia bacterium RIFOXYA12_FULL_51_18]OGS30516.1 MAG: hypothetical protein A2218_04355 [Elusimicrobia bacterium RIFOXYA2_FULL_53_38]